MHPLLEKASALTDAIIAATIEVHRTQGLPDTKVGTFTQVLYDEATKNGWTVISMKKDWNRIIVFEQ
jgi:hypothetical protein